jgi:hypothetical protein
MENFVELMVVKDDGSGQIAHPIHLIRDPDGVWRIEAM